MNERHFFPFPSLSMLTDFPNQTGARLPCLRSSFEALVSSQEILSRPSEAIKSSFPVLHSFVRMWTLIEGEKREAGLGSWKAQRYPVLASPEPENIGILCWRPGPCLHAVIWMEVPADAAEMALCRVLKGSVICWEGHFWSWPSSSVPVPDLEGFKNSTSELPSAHIWDRLAQWQDQNPSFYMPFLKNSTLGVDYYCWQARRKSCPYPT